MVGVVVHSALPCNILDPSQLGCSVVTCLACCTSERKLFPRKLESHLGPWQCQTHSYLGIGFAFLSGNNERSPGDFVPTEALEEHTEPSKGVSKRDPQVV